MQKEDEEMLVLYRDSSATCSDLNTHYYMPKVTTNPLFTRPTPSTYAPILAPYILDCQEAQLFGLSYALL
jgi:hypothetical protein